MQNLKNILNHGDYWSLLGSKSVQDQVSLHWNTIVLKNDLVLFAPFCWNGIGNSNGGAQLVHIIALHDQQVVVDLQRVELVFVLLVLSFLN
jgi:hypothetical protein